VKYFSGKKSFLIMRIPGIAGSGFKIKIFPGKQRPLYKFSDVNNKYLPLTLKK
jgi:hypothetical protein